MTGSPRAVILAAGRGSRLIPATETCPKPLLPLGPRSASDPTPTTFLERHIELLGRAGVEDVIVVVGHLRRAIIERLEASETSVRIVANPAEDMSRFGSLHSFQLAVRAGPGVLDGSRPTLLMDADIVYHPGVLHQILDAPSGVSSLSVCRRRTHTPEKVLVWGTPERPRFLGKGLSTELVGDLPCIGEATGLVCFAPVDHALARATMTWLLGDPGAPAESPARHGFGPARQGTEHEELTERLLRRGRMRALTFPEERWPYLEVDDAEEYARARREIYPRILALERS